MVDILFRFDLAGVDQAADADEFGLGTDGIQQGLNVKHLLMLFLHFTTVFIFHVFFLFSSGLQKFSQGWTLKLFLFLMVFLVNPLEFGVDVFHLCLVG